MKSKRSITLFIILVGSFAVLAGLFLVLDAPAGKAEPFAISFPELGREAPAQLQATETVVWGDDGWHGDHVMADFFPSAAPLIATLAKADRHQVGLYFSGVTQGDFGFALCQPQSPRWKECVGQVGAMERNLQGEQDLLLIGEVSARLADGGAVAVYEKEERATNRATFMILIGRPFHHAAAAIVYVSSKW